MIADGVYTLGRLFNKREGFSKTDDTLPRRCLNEPLPDGPAKENAVALEGMPKDYYYQDATGARTAVCRKGND